MNMIRWDPSQEQIVSRPSQDQITVYQDQDQSVLETQVHSSSVNLTIFIKHFNVMLTFADSTICGLER